MSRAGRPRVASLLALTLALVVLAGGAIERGVAEPAARIQIRGSDTMLRLVQLWAEAYMTSHPGVVVEVAGGGSGKGLRALIRGDVDLASASRPLAAAEAQQLLERQGSLGFAVLTARDALSVYLHPENPVTELSLDELRGIFSGTIRRWSEVGGDDAEIQVLRRNPASGTHFFFGERVLGGGAYSRRARVLPTTEAIVDEVRRNVHAVGYGGMGYAEGVRPSVIEGVEPSAGTVRDGTYPIARYLYLYTARPPRGAVREFLDWVLGSEGQRLVTAAGHVALYEPGQGSSSSGSPK